MHNSLDTSFGFNEGALVTFSMLKFAHPKWNLEICHAKYLPNTRQSLRVVEELFCNQYMQIKRSQNNEWYGRRWLVNAGRETR